MTCRTILQWPNKSLSEVSNECGTITEEVVGNVTDVVDTLRASFGVGLAAPQVGIQKRIVVIAPSVAELENPYPQDEFSDHFILIDPVLTTSGPQYTWNEACLSVPFVTAPIRRHSAVNVSFTNLKGERVTMDFKMPMSGILQHECDHLDGTLFIDRAGRFFKERLIKKLNKEKKLFKRSVESDRRQMILEAEGPRALRRYVSSQNATKKPVARKKSSGKTFGRNKKRK